MMALKIVKNEELSVLLTEGQASELLACKPSSLQSWRCQGKGPVFVKVGKLVRYRYGDILKFIENNLKHSTSG